MVVVTWQSHGSVHEISHDYFRETVMEVGLMNAHEITQFS